MTYPSGAWGFQNPGIVVAQEVIISGGVTGGLFIYNGPAGPGNPPVLSAVAPGVTTDPFGNPVGAVLNIGNFSAAHVGFDQNGNVYIVNSADQIQIQFDAAHGSLVFFGPGGAVANNLAYAISPVQYVEFFSGQTVPVGFTAYGATGFTNIAQNAIFFHLTGDVFDGGIVPIAATGGASGVPSLDFISPSNFNAGGNNSQAFLGLVGESSDTTRGPYIFLGSLQTGATLIQTIQTLVVGKLGWASAGVAGGALALTGANLDGSSGELLSTSIRDGNTYDTERLTLIGQVQTFNSVAFTDFTGFRKNLAVGKYKFRAIVNLSPLNAAGAASFQFTGTATVAFRINATGTNTGSPGSLSASLDLTALGTSITGGVFPATRQVWIFEGTINVTVAGTFGLQGACTIAADTFSIAANGTEFELSPVIAS